MSAEDRVLQNDVSPAAVCVITGLYETWGLPEGRGGLRVGFEGKKMNHFPHDGFGLPAPASRS